MDVETFNVLSAYLLDWNKCSFACDTVDGFCFVRNQNGVCLNVNRNLSSTQNFIVDPSRLVKSGWITVLQALLKLVSS